MIFLISGDDRSAVLFFIQNKKKEYVSENVFEFTGSAIDIREIEDITNSTSIFGDKKIIVMIPHKIAEIDFSLDFLQDMSDSKEIEIVIDGSKLQKNTKIYKSLKTFAKEQSFSKPRDYTNFNISDAIFLDKDKKKALKLISEVSDLDSEIFSITSTLQGTLRNYVSMRYRNESWNSLHPFVKKKITSMKLTKTEVQKYYKALHELDMNLKSTSDTPLVLLQNFVIYL